MREARRPLCAEPAPLRPLTGRHWDFRDVQPIPAAHLDSTRAILIPSYLGDGVVVQVELLLEQHHEAAPNVMHAARRSDWAQEES